MMSKNNYIKSNLLLAAAAITVLNFQSCSKYEDNSTFTLRSKIGRLTGDWEIIKIAGQNPDSYMNNSFYSYGYYGNAQISFSNVEIEWEFESDGDLKMRSSYDRVITRYVFSGYNYNTGTWNYDTITTSDSRNNNSNADWEWDDNKEEIEINSGGVIRDFEIKKLTNSELNLEYNNEEWEFIKL